MQIYWVEQLGFKCHFRFHLLFHFVSLPLFQSWFSKLTHAWEHLFSVDVETNLHNIFHNYYNPCKLMIWWFDMLSQPRARQIFFTKISKALMHSISSELFIILKLLITCLQKWSSDQRYWFNFTIFKGLKLFIWVLYFTLPHPVTSKFIPMFSNSQILVQVLLCKIPVYIT